MTEEMMLPDDSDIEGVLNELGPLPAQLTKFPGGTARGSSEQFLRDWMSDANSHLLVISGNYGAGKSHLLNKIVRPERPGAIIDYSATDIPKVGDLKDETRVFIDHFDEAANYGGTQRRAPDLRSIAPHLKKMKVCLVTNRPLTDKSHELVRQLRYPSRLEALGVRQLQLLTVETWPTAFVQKAIDSRLPSASRHFSNIAASLNPADMSEMLRPMVLRMFLAIISRQPEDWIPEYGEIYEQYLEHALSWAYDQGRSLISSLDKRLVLMKLAYSIFSGKDTPIKNARSTGVVSLKVVSDKLNEVRQENRAAYEADYDLAGDFMSSNGCLVSLGSSLDRSGTEFRFASGAIFEYFLAQTLVERYLKASTIGIGDDRFSPAILDTRMLYFARRALSKSSPDPILELLGDKSLGNIDRLILLYLIEDKEPFVKYLTQSPESYFTYLLDVANKMNWHFMVKIARFQLVSAGRMSASEYLDYIQMSEEPSHLEVELQICRTPTGNLDYLESRFANVSLRNSAAISIYRMAQIDPARAKLLVEGQTILTDVQAGECRDAFARALESNARRLVPAA